MLNLLMMLAWILTISNGYAACFEEAKDLDGCLQCCTDTSQIANVFQYDLNLKARVYAICKTHEKLKTVSPTSKEAKDFYAKYHFGSNLFEIVCKSDLTEKEYKAEPYSVCIYKCQNKFPDGTH